MADDTLKTIISGLDDLANLYLQSKSLDFAHAQAMQKQANIEIDRQLQVERDDKEIAVKILDSQMTRAFNEMKTVQSETDKYQSEYQISTGEMVAIDDLNRTSSGSEVQTTIHKGVLDQYGLELKELQGDILDQRALKNELIGRLGDIDQMRIDIKGGAGGFAGGTDLTAYDPGDFSYEDYIKRTGVEGQPWLQQAYREPTPVDITALNKSLLDIDYKKAYIGARSDVDFRKATDAYLKGLYTQVQRGQKGFGIYKSLLTTAGTFTEEGKEDDLAYQNIKLKLDAEMERIVSYLDPVNYEKTQSMFAAQGFTEEMIDQYSAGDTSFMKDWTEKQRGNFVWLLERRQKFMEGTFFEGFNAVEKLQGAKGIMGTGEDLQKLVMKKVSQYNSLMKTEPEKAAQLAYSFRQMTGIDVSKQSDIEDLEMVVENEGFVGTQDRSLRSPISKSKDTPTFKGSIDYNLLRDGFLKGDTYPDNEDYKDDMQFLLKDLIPKWGRSEIMDAIEGWN